MKLVGKLSLLSLLILFLLPAWLTACSRETPASPPFLAEMKTEAALSPRAPEKSYEQINRNVTPENTKFFKDHLSQCPDNEIRCLWFPGDHVKAGTLMTIDLKSLDVSSVREVYNWATHGSEPHRLSHHQAVSLKEVLTGLPPTVENVPFGGGVHLSFWRDGRIQTVTYDRKTAPVVLQRLYDIGGGYLDCTYTK